MKAKKPVLEIVTIILLAVVSLAGVLSINFSSAYEFTNQYQQKVELYGYGIYEHDSYFQATISVGTDLCIFFVFVPMFVKVLWDYMRKKTVLCELKLTAMYAVSLYYAASIGLGLSYNRLFLLYLLLFSCSLFGTFLHVKHMKFERAVAVTKGLKIFLILVGIALFVAWLPDVIPTAVKGTAHPMIGVYTTFVTYVFDMGIISPLCFMSLYFLKKKDGLGTVMLAAILRAGIIIGIMMIFQTVCQTLGGCDLPLAAVLTKSASFAVLGGFAYYFERKMYKELADEKEER